MLRIDTIRSASSAQANWEEKTKETIAAIGSSCIAAVPSEKPATSFDWYISVRDAKLLWSLKPVKKYFEFMGGHMEMASSPASSVVFGASECAHGIRQPSDYLYSRDIIFQDHMWSVSASEVAIKWMWTCPPVPTVF